MDQIKNISISASNTLIKELREAGVDELNLTMIALLMTDLIADKLQEILL
jgi:hypothetical protein